MINYKLGETRVLQAFVLLFVEGELRAPSYEGDGTIEFGFHCSSKTQHATLALL